MDLPKAIIVAAAIIAAGIVFVFRWEIIATPPDRADFSHVERLDRWTGNVTLCDRDVKYKKGLLCQ